LESEFPYNKTQAVSFNSCSKGFLGECGFRGGYAEFLNFDKEVLEQFRKMKNIYKGANNIG
jgi:alanine transaminase